MKKALVLLLSIPLAAFAYETAEQTDWSGGDGVHGPVTDWEDTFDTSVDINWSGNPGDLALSRIEHLVDGDFDGARCVYAADVDGDNDMDILCSACYDDEITWRENDGSGGGWIEHMVDGDFDGAHSVYAADIDGDDDTDVLGTAFTADDIVWWENLDGSGTTWTEHTVDGNFDGAWFVYAADVDGDDDLDILGAASGADDITWWENLDGSGTTWTEHTVDGDFDGANHVYAADVDGDDDMDVLGTAGSTDDIAWWEVTRFADIGRLTASILDTEDLPWWGVITWTADVPDDSYLTVKVRASDDPGDMGDWTTVTSSGDDLSDYIADDLRYFHYRLIMEASSDYDLTPTFEDITIEWTDHSGVDNVEIFANYDDSGVLIGWSITGDTPLGLRVLRSVDGSEPVAIHDNPLPGSATSYLDRKDNGFGPLAGVEYCYWLEVTDADGMTSRFGPTEPVQIEPKRLVLSLDDPYPSPAQDVVTLGYTLPNACSVELCVYDLAGRRVATLVTGAQSAGRHEVSWDCADQVPGVYLLRLSAPSGVMAGRLVVAR
ncbi:VCBS repeat-containing protein [bacterium]|nr:VCBS repeat-containing protein [bacterium]